MPLAEADARELLKKVLGELWAADRKPILGARLKLALLNAALRGGSEFDQRALGYRSFAEFVLTSGVAAVRFRTGTDALVAPIEQAQELDREPDKRTTIRADFWRAFVNFPIPGEARAYDRTRDVVVIGPPATIPPDSVPIKPISLQTQLEWRRRFIDSLGPDSPLAGLQAALGSSAGLRDFSQLIKRNPDLLAKWNKIWVNEICGVVRAWGQQHDIPDDVWLSSPAGQQETLRAKLYEVLDTIPIENLLDLRIPLRWLVERRPSK